MRRYWWMVCAVVALAGMTAGLLHGDYGRVRRLAEDLCTGCIGLTGASDHR